MNDANNLLLRIRSAVLAFKDPMLVLEAQGMRQIVRELGDGNDLALMQARYYKGNLFPAITRVSYKERQAIRKVMEDF